MMHFFKGKSEEKGKEDDEVNVRRVDEDATHSVGIPHLHKHNSSGSNKNLRNTNDVVPVGV